MARQARTASETGYYHIIMRGNSKDCLEPSPAGSTSNGALSSYIYHYGKIAEEARHIVIEQGYSMGKPSEIFALLQFEDGEITRVKVGGKVMNIAEY